MRRVSFDIKAEEAAVVTQIVERYLQMVGRHGFEEGLHAQMDIVACHANGNPLRLADLLGADDFNFLHDCLGIERNLCRDTGQLKNSFLPRFSVPRSEREIA